jgi:AAA family ATP:ADP antiporter
MIKLQDFKTEISPLLETLFRKLFDIREGEGIRAGLMFLYIFLTISTLLIIKPVSYALFLSRFGVIQLPFAFILVSIFAVMISVYYSRKLKKENLNLLIIQTLVMWIISLFIFWFLLFFNFQRNTALYLFFIWVAIFAVVSTSQFWILSNIIFNAREAKRLFGFIGAGAIAGGIFGGYLTKFMAPIIGSENLILLCMGLLSACIPITKTVWREKANHESSDVYPPQIPVAIAVDNPMKLIKRSRHLTYLAGIVGISVLVAKLIEYQFSAVASMKIAQEDQLTAFFGFWLSNLNVISLLIQLFVTRRVVGVFGVGTSLFFLPVGIFLSALAILVHPALWSAIVIKICDGSLKQSINKAGMELLALPIPVDIKNQAKSFIDIFIDSFATGIGGVLLILLTLILNFSVSGLSLIIIVLVSLWIYLILNVKGEYIKSIRLKIDLPKELPQEFKIDLQSESVIGGLIKILESNNKKNILRVLRMVKQIKNERLAPYIAGLLQNPAKEIRLEVLQNLYFYKNDYSGQVEKLIFDPDNQIKVEAFHYLFQHRSENRIKTIQRYLKHENYAIKSAALICAARESRDNSKLRKTFRIKERVEEEIKRLKTLEDNTSILFIKKTCARIIGASDIPELHPYLHILLHERSPEILRTAIESAGQSRNSEFIPVLIHFLIHKNLLQPTAQALANYQPQIFDILNDRLKNEYENKNIRLNIPHVLSIIGGQKSVDVLILNLERANPELRYQIVKALYQLRTQNTELHFDRQRIVRYILFEAREYVQIWAVLFKQLNKEINTNTSETRVLSRSEIDKAHKQLIKDLEYRLDNDLDRIFILLGLKYPPEDIFKIYLGLKSRNSDTRINAIEFLDNILEVDLKKVLIPIVETSLVSTLIDETLDRFGLKMPSEFECLVMLMTGDDPSLQMDTLNLVAQLKDDRYLRYVGQLVNSNDRRIKKTALRVLQEIEFTT